MNETNVGDFSMEDIYFKDAFTKTGDKLNLEVNDVTVDSIISKNNKFGIDNDGNLTVNSISSNQGLNMQICNLIYPVGSIYLSVNQVDPAALFGGSWDRIQDRFLLGSGQDCPNGTTGGAPSVTSGEPSNNLTGAAVGNTGSTALTVEQIPSHNHRSRGSTFIEGGSGAGSVAAMNFAAGNYKRYHYETTLETGGGQGHTHTLNAHTHTLNAHTHNVSTMPPYLAVSIWKRIA